MTPESEIGGVGGEEGGGGAGGGTPSLTVLVPARISTTVLADADTLLNDAWPDPVASVQRLRSRPLCTC